MYALTQWVKERSSRIDLLNGKATAITPDRFAVRSLWDSIIRKSIQGISPEESYALAGQAASADLLLNQWIDLSGQESVSSGVRGFTCWQQSVKATMNHRKWFTNSDWMVHFAQQLANGNVPPRVLPEAITMRGFVEISNLENTFISALRRHGVEVSVTSIPVTASFSCLKAGFPDVDSEIAAAAEWSKQQVTRGCQNVALIINGLDAMTNPVLRILENTFDPQGLIGHSRLGDSRFCVPSGSPLSTHPLVSDALLLLRLAKGADTSVTSSRISAGCFCPAVGVVPAQNDLHVQGLNNICVKSAISLARFRYWQTLLRIKRIRNHYGCCVNALMRSCKTRAAQNQLVE